MKKIRQSRLHCARLAGAVVAALVAIAMSGCWLGSNSLAEIREMQENTRYAETIAPLRAMLDENPDQPEVNFLLGKALMRTGDSSSAVWPLRRAMGSPDHVVEAGLLLGKAELASRTPRDVLRAVEPVLELEPDNVEALTLRAQGYIKAIRRDEALADLERALELDPEHLEALVPRVLILIELERIEEAEQALVEAKETIETTTRPVGEPLQGRLCIANALFTYEKGDVEGSTPLYEECLAAYPTNSIVVGQAVVHFDRVDQSERATELLQKAYEEADTPNFGKALARRMGRIGQPEEHERLLREEAERRSTANAWFSLADFYVLRERYDEACDAFEQALAADPDPAPMTVFAYVDTLIQAERYDDARREVQKLDQAYMKNLLMGRLLLATGDAQGALREFESGLRLWPNNSTARFFAGQAAEQLGDFDRAIAEYRETLRKRGDTGETDAALSLSHILVDRGTPHAAYPVLRRYIDGHRTHREALLLLIQIGRELNRANVVREGMTRLVRSGMNSLAMAQQIETIAEETGPEAAIEAADKSGLDLADPKNAEALGALIEQLAVLGRHDDARKRVADGLEQHPDSAEFHSLAARALQAAGGDQEQVRAGFERSLELEPERADALIGLAELAAASGANAEAIALYDRALTSTPDDPAPARAAVALLQGPEQAVEREKRLTEMVTRNPRDAFAANALALSLVEREADLALALSFAERAAYFVTVPEAKETLGWVHLLRGENAKAVEILQAYVDSRPDGSRARYRLGLALAALGDAERARKEFDAVIELDGAEREGARREIARMTKAAGPS